MTDDQQKQADVHTRGPRCTPESAAVGHVLGGSTTCSACRMRDAAPELLAALDKAVSAAWGDYAWVDEARTAIARARGPRAVRIVRENLFNGHGRSGMAFRWLYSLENETPDYKGTPLASLRRIAKGLAAERGTTVEEAWK